MHACVRNIQSLMYAKHRNDVSVSKLPAYYKTLWQSFWNPSLITFCISAWSFPQAHTKMSIQTPIRLASRGTPMVLLVTRRNSSAVSSAFTARGTMKKSPPKQVRWLHRHCVLKSGLCGPRWNNSQDVDSNWCAKKRTHVKQTQAFRSGKQGLIAYSLLV